MLLSLSLTLALAVFAALCRIYARDEIVKLAATSVMVVCLFLTVVFAPTVVKLFILAVPFLGSKLPTETFF